MTVQILFRVSELSRFNVDSPRFDVDYSKLSLDCQNIRGNHVYYLRIVKIKCVLETCQNSSQTVLEIVLSILIVWELTQNDLNC